MRTHFRTCFGSWWTCFEAIHSQTAKSTEPQLSKAKVPRAALAILCTLPAWAVRDRPLNWISAPSAVLRKGWQYLVCAGLRNPETVLLEGADDDDDSIVVIVDYVAARGQLQHSAPSDLAPSRLGNGENVNVTIICKTCLGTPSARLRAPGAANGLSCIQTFVWC
jgi:hypothetical protein